MVLWAIAGAGWAGSVHGLAISALPGAAVVAVASRTTESATSLAAEAGGRAVGYDDLPGEAHIVVVATPPARHAADALRAVAGGAAAVIEKPLCTTLEEADRLVRVDDAGAVLVYAENLLFSDVVSEALSQVALLGPLRHLTARALQPRPTWGGFTERSWGGGVLFDLGAHPLALVMRAAGVARPVSVSATFATSPDIEVEDLASVSITFDSGLIAEVQVSWREADAVWDLQAASDEGAVWFSLLPEVHLERNGEAVALPSPPPGDHPPQLDTFGYVAQLREATRAMSAGTSPTISDVRFGRDVLEIVCAASESARTGEPVALPWSGPRNLTPVQIWSGADARGDT